jgi:hypothetical protein
VKPGGLQDAAAGPREEPPRKDAPKILDRLSLSAEALDTSRRAQDRIRASIRVARAAAGSSLEPGGAEQAMISSREAEAVIAEGERELRSAARVSRLSARHQRLLSELRAAGCPTGRWIEERGRGFFLEEVAAEVPAGERLLKLHEGPWDGVENAPPMEPPAVTLRRAELVRSGTRADAGYAGFLWLVFFSLFVWWTLDAFVVPLPGLPIAAAQTALLALALVCFPTGRRRFLAHSDSFLEDWTADYRRRERKGPGK